MRPGGIDAWARVEEELLREKATALGRIAETLEGLLAELCALRKARPLTRSERAVQRGVYRALRDRARQHRWYLEVQREALGLRGHEGLDKFYPLPPSLPDAGPADSIHQV